MIFTDTVAVSTGRKPEMTTVTFHEATGRYVNVTMTEEELFRSVLGDAEYERRLEASALKAATRAQMEGVYIPYQPKRRWWEWWK